MIAFAEGSSLLLLVFITVPLKHVFDIPGPSKIIGLIHGLLFVLYALQTIQLKIEKDWPLKDLFMLLAAAFIPFGTFYFVPKIIRKHDV